MTATLVKKEYDASTLDAMTHGAFTADTSGERAGRIRDWLAGEPGADELAAVFKLLSVKDKGAAKLVRDRIDEARRSKEQENLVAEWAERAMQLLAAAKLNIADALAWQRDAAKAGAPLSKEPLAGLKLQLVERVRSIEDLQHQVQVQREAAVLLAQRIEVLSTKPWADAAAALESLRGDVSYWQSQADRLVGDAGWPSVDLKFPPLLDASRGQLLVVWDAFQGAVGLALTAAADAMAPLPPVPVWADELRGARASADALLKPAVKAPVDPQLRANAVAAVQEVLARLEAEVGEGHGKASAGAAAALRQALKEHGKLIDAPLDSRAHAALAAAGEMEGWQRWRADQLRAELVAKAEALLARPEGQELGGRKMQEQLRALREQWKLTDQGGVPNHALWKRFDEACNTAHKVVEAWLERSKAEAAEHRAQRLALIDEVNAWAQANQTALDDDWKGFNRILHQFADRWRDGGHVGEKMFAELQPRWKQAFAAALAPLEAVQAQSLAIRQALIEEARVLGAAPVLRVDAVRALQQRWQAEAHRIPIDRRQEQKLWDAFRKPIDDAFNRKTAEREQAQAALSARDRAVLEASKALQQANAAGDAQAIKAAMAVLDQALRGQELAQADARAAGQQAQDAKDAQRAQDQAPVPEAAAQDHAQDSEARGVDGGVDAVPSSTAAAADAPAAAPAAVKPEPKRVIAVRGDDRPGVKKEAPAMPARAGKWGERKEGARPGGPNARSAGTYRNDDRGRDAPRADTPRLGDTAFRAQREALENAQSALKRLAVQAHGEALTQLLTAWEKRDADLLPSAQDLGAGVSAATRSSWQQALRGAQPAASAKVAPEQALLRLEIAAEVATPAEHMAARRALQLQMLTRRNDPTPTQTWGLDVAWVMTQNHQEDAARRLQQALKALLRRS